MAISFCIVRERGMLDDFEPVSQRLSHDEAATRPFFVLWRSLRLTCGCFASGTTGIRVLASHTLSKQAGCFRSYLAVKLSRNPECDVATLSSDLCEVLL